MRSVSVHVRVHKDRSSPSNTSIDETKAETWVFPCVVSEPKVESLFFGKMLLVHGVEGGSLGLLVPFYRGFLVLDFPQGGVVKGCGPERVLMSP